MNLIANYVTEREYEGHLRDNVELVMIFEEDDVEATFPAPDPPSPHSEPEPVEEDPDETRMATVGQVTTVYAALAHLDPDAAGQRPA